MEKKKLCMVVHVFGEKYMSYIPFYVYSIYKAYPEYDVRIYVSEEVPSNIREQLDYLKENGCENFIITNEPDLKMLTKKAKKSFEVKRAYRFLYFDPIFYNYEAIYIGDVDIFVCKEKDGIYEQHIKHCMTLGVPYSNLSRKRYCENNYKRLIVLIAKYGIRAAFHNYKKGKYVIKRLTGLHFFRMDKEFCDKIQDAIEEVVKELNEIFEGTHKELNVLDMNLDEGILYRIIQKTGYKIYEPESLEESKFNTDYTKVVFRPHHGIHAGIFTRYGVGKNLTQKVNNVTESSMYQEYYSYYKELKKEDVVLQKLCSADTYAAQIFKKVDIYYENCKKQARSV